jgi:hypothetical protein
MTIVQYDYKPKLQRKLKPVKAFPHGRIVTACKPKPRHDDAERTRRVAAFIERTLKPQR